ncbi:hypothetical protein ZT91_000190 [Salmonella enterica subsp. enterica]|nr:hypothetical protein [Salmonella enterica subsp. enterica]EEI7297733.1 hypothetical protein [Salmonella enterica subsp. enterica serovar Saintpaul]
MHSVSFGCWTPKLRVIVYDNFNQDVYKKWLCFIKKIQSDGKKSTERKRDKYGIGKA